MKLRLGVGEKAVFAYLILLVAALVLIGYLMFVQFGLEDKFLVPFWNILLFAIIVFAFLLYIWERDIPIKELIIRTLKMLLMLYGWSTFTGFLAFLLAGGKRLFSHLEYAYTALPLFVLNMLFVVLISYLQWKIFTNPLIRGILETNEMGGATERVLEELESEEIERGNPFEFQPDPLVSFEELPSFFIKKVKGLLGCIIFDRNEGLVLANSNIPNVSPERIAAMTSYLIEVETETIKSFLPPKNPYVDTFVRLPNRTIVFSSHLPHPIFFLFDSRVPLPYIRKVVSTIPGIVEEWLRRKAFSTVKGA